MLEEKEVSVQRVREVLNESSVTWVHVEGLEDDRVLQQLGDLLGLHRLALEDVVSGHQRAKVEEYGDHIFIVVQVVLLREQVHSQQLSIFLGKHFVLTLQESGGDILETVRERLRTKRGRIRQAGSDYLAYSVLDAVVDAYFPVIDEHGERLEQMDEQVSHNHSVHFMDELHSLRGDLMTLRRTIRPLRDALVLLMPDPHSLITETTQLYFRDCFDHVVQIMELLDNYRETCSDLRDYYLSSVNARMNEVMKVLTIISTIFMPLTFIAGIYGMNFNTSHPANMPELNWPFGYVFALLLMLIIGATQFFFIWRKGWFASNEMTTPPSPENPDPDE